MNKRKIGLYIACLITTEIAGFCLDWYVVGKPFTWLETENSRGLSLLVMLMLAIMATLPYMILENEVQP